MTTHFEIRKEIELSAGVDRRHRGATHKGLGQGDRVDTVLHQSRSNSLIEVFDRVWASTVFTMTAQARLGRLGSWESGRLPGTTTL